MADDSAAQIRAIIAARAAAVGAGDLDAMLADVAPDAEMFDVVDPLRRRGVAALRARAAEWLSAYDGPVAWEDRDVMVVAEGDVGFSHGLSRVTGRLKAGGTVDMWFRKTLGFRRIAGRWRIVHDHGSVPFDPATGKPSLGLKP